MWPILATSFATTVYRMQTNLAIAALAALAQESRFAAFRLLVQAGPQGQSASSIAASLQIPASSLSFHLKELTHAGLIAPRQQGRFIIYAAKVDTVQRLMGFLDSSCGGAGYRPATTLPMPDTDLLSERGLP